MPHQFLGYLLGGCKVYVYVSLPDMRTAKAVALTVEEGVCGETVIHRAIIKAWLRVQIQPLPVSLCHKRHANRLIAGRLTVSSRR